MYVGMNEIEVRFVSPVRYAQATLSPERKRIVIMRMIIKTLYISSSLALKKRWKALEKDMSPIISTWVLKLITIVKDDLEIMEFLQSTYRLSRK